MSWGGRWRRWRRAGNCDRDVGKVSCANITLSQTSLQLLYSVTILLGLEKKQQLTLTVVYMSS